MIEVIKINYENVYTKLQLLGIQQPQIQKTYQQWILIKKWKEGPKPLPPFFFLIYDGKAFPLSGWLDSLFYFRWVYLRWERRLKNLNGRKKNYIVGITQKTKSRNKWVALLLLTVNINSSNQIRELLKILNEKL